MGFFSKLKQIGQKAIQKVKEIITPTPPKEPHIPTPSTTQIEPPKRKKAEPKYPTPIPEPTPKQAPIKDGLTLEQQIALQRYNEEIINFHAYNNAFSIAIQNNTARAHTDLARNYTPQEIANAVIATGTDLTRYIKESGSYTEAVIAYYADLINAIYENLGEEPPEDAFDFADYVENWDEYE